MKRHHDHSNSYKGKHLTGWLVISEVYSIIIMGGHGGMQADMVLEKELRVEKELHLDFTGNRKWSETLGVA